MRPYDNETLTLIEESQVEGIIICENNEVTYCSPSAQKILDFSETDFPEKLSNTRFAKAGTNAEWIMAFSEMLSQMETSFQVVGDD